MYLIELDKETGLIKDDPILDGWMAIKSFREIAAQKDGLKKMTVIALYADHLSPIRYYGNEDRFMKAMDIVLNKREKTFWVHEVTQQAVEDYKTLQYSHEIAEGEMYKEQKISALQKIETETDDNEKSKFFKKIKELNEIIDQFNKRNETKDLFSESPVRNNYKLQRLEIKLLNKKSFYHERNNIRKPESGLEN